MGYNPGPIDGEVGPKTRAALERFCAAHNPERITPIADEEQALRELADIPELPWVAEMLALLGKHERRDNAALHE